MAKEGEHMVCRLSFAGGLGVQEQGRIRHNVESNRFASRHQAEVALLLEDPLTVYRMAIHDGTLPGTLPALLCPRWISSEMASRHSCPSLSPYASPSLMDRREMTVPLRFCRSMIGESPRERARGNARIPVAAHSASTAHGPRFRPWERLSRLRSSHCPSCLGDWPIVQTARFPEFWAGVSLSCRAFSNNPSTIAGLGPFSRLPLRYGD
jgi:hypothetical protein